MQGEGVPDPLVNFTSELGYLREVHRWISPLRGSWVNFDVSRFVLFPSIWPVWWWAFAPWGGPKWPNFAAWSPSHLYKCKFIVWNFTGGPWPPSPLHSQWWISPANFTTKEFLCPKMSKRRPGRRLTGGSGRGLGGGFMDTPLPNAVEPWILLKIKKMAKMRLSIHYQNSWTNKKKRTPSENQLTNLIAQTRRQQRSIMKILKVSQIPQNKPHVKSPQAKSIKWILIFLILRGPCNIISFFAGLHSDHSRRRKEKIGQRAEWDPHLAVHPFTPKSWRMCNCKSA